MCSFGMYMKKEGEKEEKEEKVEVSIEEVLPKLEKSKVI